MNIELAKNIDPNKFRDYLRETLVLRCKRNQSYSLRAFAADLKLDHSTLSKVLNGKRSLGKRAIKNIASRLDFDGQTIKNLMKKCDTDECENDTDYNQLAIDSFAIISDWNHYAILELTRVNTFKFDKNWIANSLGMSAVEVELSIERLIRVGLMEINVDGELIDVSGGNTTNISNDMNNSALRKMQKQLLEKSIQCIDTIDYEKRDNTSMTMAIDTEKLPLAKEEIKKFRRSLEQLLDSGEKRDQVYNLSIALCPLSNIK